MPDFEDVAYEDHVSSNTNDYDNGMPVGPVTGTEGDWDDDDDQWEDDLGLDSPTDWDEHEMNADDCADAGDQFDIEYDR
jgi:hypothetical protein